MAYMQWNTINYYKNVDTENRVVMNREEVRVKWVKGVNCMDSRWKLKFLVVSMLYVYRSRDVMLNT